jgi:hypothetical protein
MFFPRKDNPFLDEVESSNLATYRGTTQAEEKIPNPEHSATGVRSGGWNLLLYVCAKKLTHF